MVGPEQRFAKATSLEHALAHGSSVEAWSHREAERKPHTLGRLFLGVQPNSRCWIVITSSLLAATGTITLLESTLTSTVVPKHESRPQRDLLYRLHRHGTVQDPGTNVGNFDRGINASNINIVITKYNNTYANQPTPAGKLLISNGLFTLQ